MSRAVKPSIVALLFALVLGSLTFGAVTATAQNPVETVVPKSITSEYMRACAGYIGSPVSDELQIVGSDRESYNREFTQGDLVYLNRGRNANLQAGAEYQIMRNVGPVRDLVEKQRVLGTLVQELGILRIVEVRDSSATAEITTVCTGPVNLGDVLVPYERKSLPAARPYRPLVTVGVPTGRATGQITTARFAREQLAANDIVYINIGADNGIKVGDYMTVYRPLASDPVNKFRDDKIGQSRSGGFPSDRFNTRDNAALSSGEKAYPKVAEEVPRNTLPRSLIGEIVIIRTDANTAVGIITRTTREAVIGDRVELQ
jgi:hypothetical protein